ncbi:hypothetical protein SASPL_133682 [Salvia splendens]|uniref:Uncharacterized protein n=1 Tax=Salvia splendens TaxID=180675 RepID=A0A8X8X5G1_SALSN|nr:hypothetical protein SASPL_133682 [Salvia splendens]
MCGQIVGLYSSQSCHLKQSQSRQPEAGKIKEVDLQQQPRPYGYKAIKFATKKKAKRMANAAVAEAILRLEKLVISQGGEMAQTR